MKTFFARLALTSLCLFPSAFVTTSQADTPTQTKALHYSLSEAVFSHEQRRLLLTVRVQTADLEAVLSDRAQKKVSAANLPELAPLALEYVREHVRIATAKGEKVRLEWAGQDVTSDQLFLFFEAPMTSGLRGAHITNSLFTEKLPDQINAVEIREGVIKKTLVFSRDKSELVVEEKL